MHRANMAVRIAQAGTIDSVDRKHSEPEISRVERRMLAGQDDSRRQAAGGEGMGDGGKLDGFGPGPDDQNNGTQSPP